MFEGVQYCGYVCLKGSHGIDLEHDHEEKDSLLPSSKEKSVKQEGFASSISINTHPQLSSNSEMIAKTIQQTHKTVDNSAIMPSAAATPKKSMLLICQRMTFLAVKPQLPSKPSNLKGVKKLIRVSSSPSAEPQSKSTVKSLKTTKSTPSNKEKKK